MDNRDLDQARNLLQKATAQLPEEYFMLPVAVASGDESLVQYRERVYAYELYHQLRTIWPQWPYSLAGEVDKSGHPVVRGKGLDNMKPDLLIHVPGQMDQNLLAVEIKAAPLGERVRRDRLLRDLKKLVTFRMKARYAGALLLTFGEQLERVREIAQAVGAAGELDTIELWHHAQPGSPACRIR